MSHGYRHHAHAPYERLASQFRARRPHTGTATTRHPGPTVTLADIAIVDDSGAQRVGLSHRRCNALFSQS